MSTVNAAQPRWESLTVNGKPAAVKDNVVTVSRGDVVDVRFNNIWIHDDKARYAALTMGDVQDVTDAGPAPSPPDANETRLRMYSDDDMQGGDYVMTVPPGVDQGHEYVLNFTPFEDGRPLPQTDGDFSQWLILKVSS